MTARRRWLVVGAVVFPHLLPSCHGFATTCSSPQGRSRTRPGPEEETLIGHVVKDGLPGIRLSKDPGLSVGSLIRRGGAGGDPSNFPAWMALHSQARRVSRDREGIAGRFGTGPWETLGYERAKLSAALRLSPYSGKTPSSGELQGEKAEWQCSLLRPAHTLHIPPGPTPMAASSVEPTAIEAIPAARPPNHLRPICHWVTRSFSASFLLVFSHRILWLD